MGKKSFALGYSLPVHSTLTYLIYAAAASTGLNIIVPLFAAENGLDKALVLSANTVGAFISCFAVLFFGSIIMKIGIRMMTTISLIIGGIFGTILLGYVHTLVGYAVCTIFAQCMVHGYCFAATNAMITNWWPRKKGFVMGLTTCGIMLASFTIIPYMATLGNTKGFLTMVWFVGGLMVIFGIISWFWIRDTPEQVGLHPDNIPLSEAEKQQGYFKQQTQEEAKMRWPVKEILKNKTAWLIAVVFGLFLLFTSGVASTTVLFCLEAGYAPATAIKVLTYTSLVSLAGSILSGVLDNKFGPKKTTVIYAIWVMLAFLILLIAPAPIKAIVCVAMANLTMGATANLAPSMVATCFGQKTFTQVFRVVYAISFFLRSFAFLFLGTSVKLLGSYNNAYLCFAVLALVAILLTVLINDKKLQVPSSETALADNNKEINAK